MSTMTITAEAVRELLQYDPETGVFAWKKTRRGVRPGKTGNVRPDGYVRIGIGGTNYLAHRLAWLYVTGDWPAYDIDHKDGDPQNNCFANLRDVETMVNVQNTRRATKRNQAGILGVSFHARDNLWRARIMSNGVNRCMYFKEKQDAEAAYLEAKRTEHSGCTI